MKNRVTSYIVLILTIALLASGCGGSQETPESKVDLEHEIVGQIMGDIFYTFEGDTTNTDEAEYVVLRKESITLFSDKLIAMAKDAFQVAGGFEKYENVLFEYMDIVDNDPSGTMHEITEGIIANKTARRSYQEQIEKYLSLDSEEAISKALTDRYIFETACDMVDSQKEYLSWIIGVTEVAAAMIQETDENNAEKLTASCKAIYIDEIHDHFTDMLNGYYSAAEIYTYIVSADYYMNEYYLNEIEIKLASMEEEQKEEIKEIIEAYNDILNNDRKPPILLEVSSDNQTSFWTSILKLSFPFTSVAYADDSGFEQDEYDKFVEDWRLHLNAHREESYEEVSIEDFVYIQLIVNIESARSESETEANDNFDLRRRILQDIQTDSNTDEINPEKIKEIEEQAISMANASNAIADRQAIIQRISTGQYGLDMAGLAGTDIQYSAMIRMINELITKNRNVDGEKIESISNLINNDLEEILGDKKEEFIDKIVTSNAEELLNIFDDWKKNTDNFNDFNFSKDDLIRLVNQLGVETAQIPAETEEVTPEATQDATPQPDTVADSGSGSTPTEPVTNDHPPQKVEKGYWELVKTEEVIPKTYTVGDDNDNREYTFEYSKGLISCKYLRVVYDGIKKTYLNEEIQTNGGWVELIDDGAYLPDEKIKLKLTANIEQFQRLTPVESGGTGTNTIGVAVWAYTGTITTPFGNASSGVLKSSNGESMCKATIYDGKITVPTNSLEVSGVFGPGKDKEQKVIFIVVSNQGRIGGVKYIYEYAE